MENENMLHVEEKNREGKLGKYQGEGKIVAPFSRLLCTITPYFFYPCYPSPRLE